MSSSTIRRHHIGTVVNGLTILERLGRKTRNGAEMVRVQCRCGQDFVCQLGNVAQGNTSRCKDCAYKHRSRVQRREATHTHQIYVRYRIVARKRGIDFAISEPDFTRMLSSPCAYCGCPASGNLTIRGRTVAYSGVDRQDNSKGYDSSNCVACCIWCNRSKGAKNLQDWFDWVSRVHANIEGNYNASVAPCAIKCKEVRG